MRCIFQTQQLLCLPECLCILGDVDPGLSDKDTGGIVLLSVINSIFVWLACLSLNSRGIDPVPMCLFAFVSFVFLTEWVLFVSIKNRRLKDQLPAVGRGMYFQGVFVTEKQEEGQEPQSQEVDMSKVQIDPSMYICFVV
ncbi:hypothetical protein B0T22DRAFT_483157 [Podospora appendiculata]|uniref:Uncharacterized protein n=1 Tax=Podospora appendiculata TaxID=314037 RepID=A0AAE0X270_9PEZI|nr:hypothetical protein B0T22DRAFT_483157 [Podospora appendiculata]